MSHVFVVDTNKQPLAPVHPGRARLLLTQGRAAVFRRKRGGTHRISNLTISCKLCNDQNGTRLIEEFLSEQPDVLKRILAQANALLKDAAVNTTRWALYERLRSLGLPLEVGTGGRTKWNRTRRALPKTHWLDAACVGASTPEHLQVERVFPLCIQATGRQSRQMCRMDRYGFPRTSAKVQRIIRGFQTGDIVKAVVMEGTKAGHYVGRVAVRATGSFNITITRGKTVQGISHHFCVPIHRSDGYSYTKGEAGLLA
jgi:RRXRR protein